MSDWLWLEWLLKIGSAIITGAGVIGALWWLAQRWELLQHIDEMATDWRGKPPDDEHPHGVPGVMLSIAEVKEDVTEIRADITEVKDVLAVAAATAAQVKEDLAEEKTSAEAARQHISDGLEEVKGAVGRLTQRVDEHIPLPKAVIDKLVEVVRDDDDAGGET